MSFHEVTDEVPQDYRQELNSWLRLPGANHGEVKYWRNRRDNLMKQCGLHLIGLDKIRQHRSEYFYYDGENNRFYVDVVFLNGLTLSAEDKNILKWVDYRPDWRVGYNPDLACNGKFVYRVFEPSSEEERKFAVILADVRENTKTIMTTVSSPYTTGTSDSALHTDITDEGNRLLLSFTEMDPTKRRTYLIDLKTWQICFRLDEPYYGETYLNKDGSLLYNGTGFIYNTNTGEKTPLVWPEDLDMYSGGEAGSRNLQYMTRMVGMFSAGGWVPGQWGTNVYTPEGFFRISAKDKQVIARKVFDDGTIVTDNGDVFVFENGSYKLFKTGDGKPIEVKVRKLGE